MIEKIGNPFDEQETTINVFPVQVDNKAYVYTCIPTMINRMNKLAEEYPNEVEVIHDDEYGIQYSIPRDWVKVKPKRRLSETEREDFINRLQKNKE